MDLPKKPVDNRRLPPPALFRGPPSHNASNISLSVPPTASNLAAPSSSQPRHQLPRNQPPRSNDGDSLDKRSLLSPFLSRHQSKSDVDGSDAIWQEMQSALSEVELSAMTREHAFGEKHAEVLEDLRMKQLKLAQAWARSEAGDEVVDSSRNTADGGGVSRRGSAEASGAEATARERDPAKDHVSYRTLDGETEEDIRLARKRREANDRYFDRVNQGVLDVVAKLEEVSQAMRNMERESKDIWSDSESVDAASSATTIE